MPPTLWTVGHSTRRVEELTEFLHAHGVLRLVDVRSIPYSRRNPQFNADVLVRSLASAGLHYQALPALGGRRKSRPDSVNLGWRNAGFRGYADYMQTAAFWTGVEELMELTAHAPSAIMCAEAVPWRCHRSLVADAMVSRGCTVRHILTETKADSHILTPFACVRDGRLSYPKPPDTDVTPRLF